MEDFQSTFNGDSCSLKIGSYSVVPANLSISSEVSTEPGIYHMFIHFSVSFEMFGGIYN